MSSVDVRNLGVIEYTDALDMMSKLQQQRINNEIPDTVLFLEHPEIVTVGPRARNDGIAPPSDYKSHPVDRGGGLTWHGPDQIPKDAGTLYADVHRELLNRGYMLAPSAYEIGFLSTSHNESHIHGFVEALDDSLTHLDWS